MEDRLKIIFERISESLHTDSEARPASYPMGTRFSFPGFKTSLTWSWPLADIKNPWSYTSTPSCLHGVVLN